MSSGANIGDGGPDGIGDAPTDMGAWELFQLGWLDAQGDQGPFYDVAQRRRDARRTARPTNVPATTNGAQALFTVLPDKRGPARARRAARPGATMLLVHPGRRPQQHDDQTGVTGDRAHGQGQLRHRDRLGLRVPRGLDRRRHHLDAGDDQPVADTTPVTTRAASTPAAPASPAPPAAGSDLTATLPAGTTAVRFRYQTDGAVAEQRLPGRRHRDRRHGSSAPPRPRPRAGRSTGSARTTGTEVAEVLQRLRRREPSVRRLRHVAADGVQLRLRRHASRTGWRPTRYQDGLLVTYWDDDVRRQQRRRPPGRGPDPAGRRAPAVHALDATAR